MKLIDPVHIQDSIWCDVSRHLLKDEEDKVDDVIIYRSHRFMSESVSTTISEIKHIILSTQQTGE